VDGGLIRVKAGGSRTVGRKSRLELGVDDDFAEVILLKLAISTLIGALPYNSVKLTVHD